MDEAKEIFDTSVGFAAIGSLCIFVATTILDKLNIFGLKEIVGSFLVVGFFMVFSSAALLFGSIVRIDWDKEYFVTWVVRISVIIFFFVSFALAASYVASLFGIKP